MEELLVIAFQFLIELILEIVVNLPFDWPNRNPREREPERIGGSCVVWCIGGALLGWLSVALFKHTLISVGGLRVLNLVIAPIASAYVSQGLALRRAQTNSNIIGRNHFWKAFWFTLGLVVVRFAYTTRG